jgi:hypothetical protein
MLALQDLTSAMGEAFLCPALQTLPLACVTVADTVLTSPSRYPPESSPRTPSSRWRAATHGRGLTSRLAVVG